MRPMSIKSFAIVLHHQMQRSFFYFYFYFEFITARMLYSVVDAFFQNKVEIPSDFHGDFQLFEIRKLVRLFLVKMCTLCKFVK